MSLLDKIYVNLKIISKIQENGKISTISPGQITLESETYWTSFWRTLSGDSREKTVSFLQQLLNDVMVQSDNMIRSPYFHNYDDTDMYQVNEHNMIIGHLKKLSQEMQNSKKGIVNLHATYSDDASIASKLEEVIAKIETQIEKIEKALSFTKTPEKRNPY